MTSAFGIDHGEVSKAFKMPSLGGLARGAGGHRAPGLPQLPRPSIAGAKGTLKATGSKVKSFAANRPGTTAAAGVGAAALGGGALLGRRKQV